MLIIAADVAPFGRMMPSQEPVPRPVWLDDVGCGGRGGRLTGHAAGERQALAWCGVSSVKVAFSQVAFSNVAPATASESEGSGRRPFPRTLTAEARPCRSQPIKPSHRPAERLGAFSNLMSPRMFSRPSE